MNVRNLPISVLFALLVFFTGCSLYSPENSTYVDHKAKTVVLFVPGFKGTTLADEKGKTRWITPWEATFGSTSLALPTEKLGFPGAKQLFPKDVLKQVVVIPWIYEFNTYKRFLNELRLRLPEGARIEEFPYDWRLSSASNSIFLDHKIKELRLSGAKKVILVGHSMGGTLTSYFLRYGSQSVESAISDWSGAKKVDGAVIVSTPFKGALNIFCDLQSGDQTAFNTSLMSRESEGTMESTYELLPKEKIDFKYWSENRLGILREDLPEELRVAREEFVKNRLSNAARFRELIFAKDNEQQNLKFPLYQFVGTGSPVSDSAEIDALTGECGRRISNDGDGTVTIESASLPESFVRTLSPTIKILEGEHAEILLNEIVLESIISLTNNN